ASETYVRNTENVRIELPDGEKVTYNVIETIEDKSTGLHGYVLENEITNEIVISFEGTQTKNGMTQSINDIQEDINGIVFGDSKDRKSTRLNSSHVSISYAVFCLKKKKRHKLRDYH